MPTQEHDTLVALFKDQPRLATELLRRVFQFEVPPHDNVTAGDGSYSDIKPAEYNADVLLLFREGSVVKLGVVIEVQRAFDEQKLFTTPVYCTSARARLLCPVVVLIFCTKESVARKYRKPIELGGGSVFRPLVVGPEGIPAVTSLEEARAFPELGVLSAVAYGASKDTEKALEVAICAARAVGELQGDEGRLYYDMILAALRPGVRKAFEVEAKNYEYQSDFAKKYVEQGLEQGRREARDLLRKLIRVKFQLETLPAGISERLDQATAPQLELWAERVLSASTLEEVFAE